MNAVPRSGIILVDKKEGPSSFHIIERIRRIFRDTFQLKRRELPKMGHAGTLDPFASGLLVIMVGSASRLSKHFLESQKTYEGEIEFGLTSLSGDRTNEITETSEVIPQSQEQVQKFASVFCETTYLQKPPMHSAIKVNGKRLYELARDGKSIEVKSRPKTVFEFEICSYHPPKAKFFARVSSGTYIRKLAQDLAENLGTVGILNRLRRVRSGEFGIEHSVSLDDLAQLVQSDQLYESPAWVSLEKALCHWSSVELTSQESTAIQRGNQAALFSISKRLDSTIDNAALFHGQSLIATVEKTTEGIWKLDRVFSAIN